MGQGSLCGAGAHEGPDLGGLKQNISIGAAETSIGLPTECGAVQHSVQDGGPVLCAGVHSVQHSVQD